MGQKTVILCQFLQAFLGYIGEKDNGIAAGAFPEPGINAPEKFDGIRFPAPPKVAGQFYKSSTRTVGRIIFMAFGERSIAGAERNSEGWIITGLRQSSDKEWQGIAWGLANGGEWRPV